MTIVSLLSRAQAPLEAFEVFSRRKGASDCKSIFIGESGGALSQHVPMPKIIKAKADDHSGKQQRAKQPINFTPWLRLLLVENKKNLLARYLSFDCRLVSKGLLFRVPERERGSKKRLAKI
jgi:hypothetical protein